MNDSQITVEIGLSRMWIMAVRSPRRRKGTAWAGVYRLENGRIPAEAIEQLARFDSRREADVILVLPRRQVILKYFSLPAQDPLEIRRMVDLRIGQGLPFPKEEVVYDVAVGETDASGYTRVVVAVARRQMVEKELELVGQAGLRPGRCAVSAFGIAEMSARNCPTEGNQTILTAVLEEDGVEVCFCGGRRLLFARSLAPEQSGQEFGRQLQLTLTAFQREYPGKEISKVILTGTGSREIVALDVWSHVFRCPVEEVSGWETLLPEKQAVVFLGEEAARSAFIAHAGLLESAGPDLMPPAILQAKAVRVRRLAVMRLGLSVAVVVMAFFLAVGVDLYRQSAYLDAVRQRISSGSKEAQEARRKIEFLRSLQENIGSRVLVVDLMSELYEIVPERVSFSSVQLNDGALTLQGQSRESADVNLVQKRMMESAMFKDVTLQYANRRQRFDVEYTDFRIVCRLIPGSERVQP